MVRVDEWGWDLPHRYLLDSGWFLDQVGQPFYPYSIGGVNNRYMHDTPGAMRRVDTLMAFLGLRVDIVTEAVCSAGIMEGRVVATYEWGLEVGRAGGTTYRRTWGEGDWGPW